MKKTITLLLLLITCLATHAQIPNASFETWYSFDFGAPDRWHSHNSLTDGIGIYTCEKGIGAPHGNYFIKLTSKTVGSSIVPGLAVCSHFDYGTLKPTHGFSFTGRPSHLTGKWQYMPQGTDTGRISVYLTKWNTATGKRDQVASFEYDLPGMVMSWTSFAIPLTYERGGEADTAIIALASSKSSPGAVAGSYLYVDSLNFTGYVPDGISTVTPRNYGVTLSPNPAKDKLFVDFGTAVTDNIKLQVLDIYGKLVTETTFDRGNRMYSMDLNGVAPGSYFVKVSVGEEVQTLQLVIE